MEALMEVDYQIERVCALITKAIKRNKSDDFIGFLEDKEGELKVERYFTEKDFINSPDYVKVYREIREDY